MHKNLSHKQKIISLVIILLCIFVGVGVYAGIQSEVGTYVWDSISSKWVKQQGTTGGMVVSGINAPSDTYNNPTNAVNSVGLTMGWDSAQWRRIATAVTNTSPATTANGLVTNTIISGWDGTANRRLSVTSDASLAYPGGRYILLTRPLDGATSFNRITTNTNQNTSNDYLTTIVVNTAGVASTVTIYTAVGTPCTSGTFLFTLPTTVTGEVYNVKYLDSNITGGTICVTTAGTSAADITVLTGQNN